MEAQSVIDSKAFEILVRLHHRRMRAYALAMVRRAEEAEDLVQDAFVTAYQNLAKFDTQRDFGMWLRGIIRNKYLERLRAQQHTTLDNSILEIIENSHREWDHALEESNQDALVALRQCIDRLGGASKRRLSFTISNDLPVRMWRRNWRPAKLRSRNAFNGQEKTWDVAFVPDWDWKTASP
jgi:RNA polymerase sigma factor (sigma-70 family)